MAVAAHEPRSVRLMLTVRAFRTVAVAEAVSWLALIVATVVKYAADAPMGVQVLGPIHGVLFIAYVLLALSVRAQLHWSGRTFLIVLADAILPGGGFVVARRPDLSATYTPAPASG
jgi:integral membrane protein